MAAVTRNSVTYNVVGNIRQQTYDISGGNGDTLNVGLSNVTGVFIEPTTNGPTSVTRTANTPAPGMTQLTFASGGAYTNARVLVQGN